MAAYQDFEIGESLAEQTYNAVEKSKDVATGTNEVTKAIERNEADLVVIAGNVSPEEIVMHLPALSDERDIAYTFVPDREELGLAAGINVQSAAVAITNPGSASDDVDDIAEKSRELREAEE